MNWQYNEQNPLRVCTLCSGYESQCMAIRDLGIPFDLVMWAEFDPESKAPLEKQPAVIAHNAVFPEYADRNWGDMTKIDWEKAPDFDLLFYSTPCFAAGTLVLTDSGYKKIEEIKEGDLVLTHTGKYRRVLKPMRRAYVGELCIVDVEGAIGPIVCTPEHPFYVDSLNGDSSIWLDAGKLNPSIHTAYVVDGGNTILSKKRIISIGSIYRETLVYNMEVEIDNSYTANGAVVHNCQSISNAGLQHGFVEGSGTRSSIIWNVRDAIKIKRPKIAILENVKAMISGKFVDMFNLWQSELLKFGYTNFPQVLNAKDFGIPQNRERIFPVSILGDAWYNFPQPQELKLKLKDLLEDVVDEKFYLDDLKVADFIGRLEKEKLDKICGD